jgi:pimeloyl-ACP methyl ester carboxylesterase
MQRDFKYQETNISYHVYGKGEPVVLIHGFAEDHTIWNEQIASLKNDYLVIVPDLPGSGKSEILQKEKVTIEDFATVIHEILQVEGIQKCVMLGHSLGGYITLAFATLFSEKLRGFGLVHSTAFADNEEKKQVRGKAIKFIEEHGAFSFLKSTTPNLFSQKFKNKQPEKISELIEKGHSFSDQVLIQYYATMMERPDHCALLKTCNMPALFIIGTEDTATPLQDLLKQVHLPKTAYIHILQDVGHMSMLEAPEQLNRFLLDFLTHINL